MKTMYEKNNIDAGDSFKVQQEIDKYRAIYYAGASGDFNPIHIDAEFGKMVGLGGAILQGLCTLGFTADAVTTWIGDPGRLKKLKCRFSLPVKMGDIITIEGLVTEVRGDSGTVEIKVINQNGSDVLTNVQAEVVAK
ncbi:MAG TPA: MaoC family dehydratase [Spirochaetota bacterium]|nr:MaoC family dehydratase [Spirochaetota bacterium]HOM88699.1 MaoC family dehydratase [Spirochaetota bacterium]HPK43801.1 MaoC family dehydratase [Spirochaetota bacterium]HQI37216.1 MaoC family dehydratase [Spirochaetota bacterium]HQK06747.1 MaoC family dehydratase [Spirochaetota bacterium]